MKFVCLGDSLTEGYGVRAEMCWVSLLPELTGYQWINAGISGDTTSGMLARLDRDVISRSPDGAVLMGGVNDILAAGSCSCAKTNMLAMVQQLAARQIPADQYDTLVSKLTLEPEDAMAVIEEIEHGRATA